MIIRNSHSTVYVTDQDRAKAFYTEKLGFEVREDARLGNFRWLTVAPKTQPDHCIILYLLEPGPMMDAEACAAIRKLLEKGVLGGGVLETDDCRRTYEELKAKGVHFLSEPKEMPYGIEALFRDDDGNFFSMGQKSRSPSPAGLRPATSPASGRGEEHRRHSGRANEPDLTSPARRYFARI